MVRTPATIALHRFGLGPRRDDRPPSSPAARGWVTSQLARYDPRPAALAYVPSSAQAIGLLADAYDLERRVKAIQRAEAMLPTMPVAATSAMAPPGLPGAPPAVTPPTRADAFRPVHEAYVAAIGARTNAALVSDTPFAERLVHFWSNHFALSVDKQEVTGLAGSFELEAIRPHIMGSFRDLLLAVESHPAMLLYLDQAQSIGPGSSAAGRPRPGGDTRPRRGLNENLAREIMELHTLGVRSGYSQADVTEFARALTGWTVAGIRPVPALQGLPPGFAYCPRFHEPGPRRIMGRTYAQDTEAQGRAILTDLASHPATARHIATKLARHFVGDPPPALVARLQQVFLATDGDLGATYRALVGADEAWVPGDAKFRTPWLWGVAAMRACGVTAVPPRQASGLFEQLGQQVWKPGSPAGYDDTAAGWAAPDALLRRVEAAGRMAAQAGPIDARPLADQLFPGSLSVATGQAIARAESPAQALALLLVAPEMMRS